MIITLLGQNVNSYRDTSKDVDGPAEVVPGFKTVYKTKVGGLRFAQLLERIANISTELRIRFTSPHPKDFPLPVLDVIKKYPNICKSLHIPAQAGSSSVLERMRRGYTREVYIELIKQVRNILPNVALSSDFICGFCGETEEDFEQTLSLINEIKYNVAYLFPYSMREKTTAHRRLIDDVPYDVKVMRLERMVQAYRNNAEILNKKVKLSKIVKCCKLKFNFFYLQLIGTTQLILIENVSKRSTDEIYGRCDGNVKVIIPNSEQYSIGDYVAVEITNANSQVLKGMPLEKTTLREFYNRV